MGRWQLACAPKKKQPKNARPKKIVVPLELPYRVVAAILFGRPPWKDRQASNMNKFLPRNYGLPGASGTKRHRYDDGTVELRRCVRVSGIEETHVVADIATAARSLKRDRAKETAIALVLHGNDEAVSRLYNQTTDTFEHSLNLQILKDVALYRSERKTLDQEMQTREAAQRLAIASGDEDRIADASFFVNDARRRIVALDKSFGKNVDMSALLETAANAMEESRVGVLELQACGVGGADGFASLSFSGFLARVLSTPSHTVEIRTHSQMIETGIPKGGKVVHVWLGSDPHSDFAQLSSTTLPRFSGEKR